MTQGAIDLVQTELSDFPSNEQPLLPDKPYSGPTSIVACQPAESLSITQPVDSYSWWDTASHVCISIRTPAAFASCTAECHVQRQALRLVIKSGCASSQAVQLLKLDPLHSAVKPAFSECFVDGFPAPVTHSNLCNSDDRSVPTPEANFVADVVHSRAEYPQQPCQDKALCSLSDVPVAQKLQASAPMTTDMGLVLGQPPAVTAVLPSPGKQPCRILVTLAKASSAESWPALLGHWNAEKPEAHRSAQPADMAALRRELIRQRQQRQQSHTQLASCAVLQHVSSGVPHSLCEEATEYVASDAATQLQQGSATHVCPSSWQHAPPSGQSCMAKTVKVQKPPCTIHVALHSTLCQVVHRFRQQSICLIILPGQLHSLPAAVHRKHAAC